ncbi:MAG: hypothetical protein ACTHJR_10985 [Sphingomonas sp.]|uniref:hypothetical protein n=1 Tax=Sphingomonas sp. TaxID=28214 RepID=UPI003F7FA536
MLTNNEIISRIRDGLMAQGKPAALANGQCRYRTAGGLKCAVGQLIPDEYYNHNLEGYLPGDPLISDATDTSPEQADLLKKLQKVHDNFVLDYGYDHAFNDSFWTDFNNAAQPYVL